MAAVRVDHAALLQGDALDGSGRPPESAAALREEIERLRQSAAASRSREEDVVALRGRVTHLEGFLAPEQARSAEAQAEVERIAELLAEERRTVDTLRQHPERSVKKPQAIRMGCVPDPNASRAYCSVTRRTNHVRP